VSTIVDSLAALFQSQQWEVTTRLPASLRDEFDLVAENDVAIAFVASCARDLLVPESTRLAAAIAAILQRGGGPKAWEAYLLLVVHGLGENDDEAVAAVQRDLTYCRKLVVHGESVLASGDPVASLARRLALLFPLSLADTGGSIDPHVLLEDGLVAQGHDREVVRALLDGLSDPRFDPVTYLANRAP
jgi:hypothetical protein